mgnify:FL=1
MQLLEVGQLPAVLCRLQRLSGGFARYVPAILPLCLPLYRLPLHPYDTATHKNERGASPVELPSRPFCLSYSTFIDFETGLLSITKTPYYKSMDDYKFVEPKTQASVRTIYIDADTIRELKAWQEVQKKVLKNCDLVLSYNGIPTSKHTLPRALEKLAGLAGVHRIKIHALRHLYVKPKTKKLILFFQLM